MKRWKTALLASVFSITLGLGISACNNEKGGAQGKKINQTEEGGERPSPNTPQTRNQGPGPGGPAERIPKNPPPQPQQPPR